jgi:hypothetical protein
MVYGVSIIWFAEDPAKLYGWRDKTGVALKSTGLLSPEAGKSYFLIRLLHMSFRTSYQTIL